MPPENTKLHSLMFKLQCKDLTSGMGIIHMCVHKLVISALGN